MVVVPFKERIIDYDKEVFVYRNLNRKGKWYSIKQDGLVVGYSKEVTLIDAEFVVKSSGKKRAITTKQRNVHAFIKGRLYPEVVNWGGFLVTYDPFDQLGFKSGNVEMEKAEVVYIGKIVLAWKPEFKKSIKL